MYPEMLLLFGVEYKVRLDANQVQPTFEAPKNYGPEKAQEYCNAKLAEWLSGGAARLPYSGTFKKAHLRLFVASPNAEVKSFNVVYPDKTENIGASIASWLSAHEAEYYEKCGTDAALCCHVLGFDPRAFIKMTAAEAAEHSVYLSTNWWFSPQTTYYDIENIVCPEKETTLNQAIARLCPPSWRNLEPGAKRDLLLTAWFAGRYNLYPMHGAGLSAVIEKFRPDKTTVTA